MTHICVRNLTIIVSDNSLAPTNVGLLLIEPLGTNFSEILIKIHTFSFKEMHLKQSSAIVPFMSLTYMICLSVSMLVAPQPHNDVVFIHWDPCNRNKFPHDAFIFLSKMYFSNEIVESKESMPYICNKDT